MGNCQAIDNASILIQHPNAAKIERLYAPVAAADVMKANPGHHVALLLTTTTLYSSSAAGAGESRSGPLRVTRIKLLRPTDTLVPGHAYRLVTAQGAYETSVLFYTLYLLG
ncbi:v-type ATP synthase beta chain [Striga asiatica]|uniref:V-type ATP synthase beta chain n=1 Tax=Striga asiatica TaxID=4170 RepID=A0A5A7R6Y2_STRAF|nr:v-type ATP synthase beta chain [Striga asiatica]